MRFQLWLFSSSLRHPSLRSLRSLGPYALGSRRPRCARPAQSSVFAPDPPGGASGSGAHTLGRPAARCARPRHTCRPPVAAPWPEGQRGRDDVRPARLGNYTLRPTSVACENEVVPDLRGKVLYGPIHPFIEKGIPDRYRLNPHPIGFEPLDLLLYLLEVLPE